MPSKKLELNINDQVEVELTDFGVRCYKNHYTSLNIPEKYLPDFTKRVVKMPIWTIAAIFGPYLYMGMIEMPFVDNKLILDQMN